MRKMITLMNREFWEQRGVFFNVPMVLSGIFILVAVALFILSFKYGSDVGNIQSEIVNQKISVALESFFSSIAVPFVSILWVIVFYYFLGSLYDDRKDGSILFWQSMPISQTQTICSKLFAGLILAPFCTWVVIMVTQLAILCIASLFFMAHPVIQWTELWNIPVILMTWLRLFAVMIVQALWLLPLFAWFMLCSAFAKKAPALRALVPLIVLIIIETLFFHPHYFTNFLVTRFEYATNSWYQLSLHSVDSYANVNFIKALGLSFDAEVKWITFGVGIGVSVVCCVVAGWFRSRCYDFEK